VESLIADGKLDPRYGKTLLAQLNVKTLASYPEENFTDWVESLELHLGIGSKQKGAPVNRGGGGVIGRLATRNTAVKRQDMKGDLDSLQSLVRSRGLEKTPDGARILKLTPSDLSVMATKDYEAWLRDDVRPLFGQGR
jgi:hypothetical protein